MIENLLYISSSMILFAYLIYFLMILMGRSKIVSKSNGFDITKDIISEYNSINIIESSGYFTIYNLKRKVVKLASKCYYGKDISSISLALNEAGISIVDNNNNIFLRMFKNIFNNLKVLYVFPIIAIIISHSSFNINDAKISMVIILFFAFIQYILIDIKNNVCYWVDNNIKKIKDISKDNRNKIVRFLNNLILLDKIIYFGELIIIIRFVLILFEIK